MKAATFLKEFGHLAEAPNGVQKLRELVLQLAVRGRLVEYKSKGTPIARSSHLATKCEMFPVPPQWHCEHLEDLADLKSGVTKGRNLNGRECRAFPYLRVANVQAGYLDLSEMKEIELPVDELPKFLLQDGDVLLTEGGDWDKLGRSAIWNGEVPNCIHQNHVFRARPLGSRICSEWLRLYTNSPAGREYFQRAAKKTTNLASINMTQLRNCPIPLPPLAEQRRIVAKVDELLALCDELETQQARRNAVRVDCATASLARLTVAPTPAETAGEWSRVAQHFDTLFAVPQTIPQLRQTILQLAVTGRLVEQEPGDEAAANGVSSRVGDFISLQNGYAFKSEWFRPDGVRLVRNANVSHGLLDWKDMVCLQEEQAEEYERFRLSSGDIVVSLDRPLISTGLKVAIIQKSDLPALLLQRVGRVQFKDNSVMPEFFFAWLNSPCFTSVIDPGRSNGVPHISSKEVEAIPFYPPPRGVQAETLKRLKLINSLLDTLESQLTTRQGTAERLTAAMVQAVLDGAGA